MRYYSQEEIERARATDLLTYFQRSEPEQLVRVSSGTYSTREHRSVKISNGKWMWWSHGIGGYSALDYLIKVRVIPFAKAMSMLIGNGDMHSPAVSDQRDESSGRHFISNKRLLLPDENETNDRVIRYLISRGIHPNLIKACIKRGYIYESKRYHNCMFIGYDSERVARYAFYRATCGEKIMGEAYGSDKRFSFRIDQESSVLHVFESAIDLLSFATLEKMWTGKWSEESMLSLGGAYASRRSKGICKLPAALGWKLKTDEKIRKITLHLDNDSTGRMAADQIIGMTKGSYDIQYLPPRDGKDMNDELLFLLDQIQVQKGCGGENGVNHN